MLNRRYAAAYIVELDIGAVCGTIGGGELRGGLV